MRHVLTTPGMQMTTCRKTVPNIDTAKLECLSYMAQARAMHLVTARVHKGSGAAHEGHAVGAQRAVRVAVVGQREHQAVPPARRHADHAPPVRPACRVVNSVLGFRVSF